VASPEKEGGNQFIFVWGCTPPEVWTCYSFIYLILKYHDPFTYKIVEVCKLFFKPLKGIWNFCDFHWLLFLKQNQMTDPFPYLQMENKSDPFNIPPAWKRYPIQYNAKRPCRAGGTPLYWLSRDDLLNRVFKLLVINRVYNFSPFQFFFKVCRHFQGNCSVYSSLKQMWLLCVYISSKHQQQAKILILTGTLYYTPTYCLKHWSTNLTFWSSEQPFQDPSRQNNPT